MTRIYLFQQIIASKVALLLVLLQPLQTDVFKQAHDGLGACCLLHVDNVGQDLVELEPLRLFVAEHVNGNVDVLVARALKRQLVILGHRRRSWRHDGLAGNRRWRPSLLTPPLDRLGHGLGRHRLLCIVLDGYGAEELREVVPWLLGLLGRLGRDTVRLHRVAVSTLCLLTIFLGLVLLSLLLADIHVLRLLFLLVIVVQQPSLNLHAVRGFRVGREIEIVSVDAASSLPQLVLDRVGNPDPKGFVALQS